MKYLIVGLGNIGPEYADTRHNIGFMTLDALAKASNVVFDVNKRYGAIAEMRVKNAQLVMLKPSTYMNSSGDAVRYWLQKEKIDIKNLLVVVDDLSLPFGTLRLKPQGSDGGHNGLKSINIQIETTVYSRLRFGIGNDFSAGRQINFVLSPFTDEECEQLPARIEVATEIVKSFCLAGVDITMNQFNNK